MIYLIIYLWTCVAFIAGAAVANRGSYESWRDVVLAFAFSWIIVPYIVVREIRNWRN
jgi:hypothetical protein